jgi:hypothetical protein
VNGFILIFSLTFILLGTHDANALTQFYFALPQVIEDLDGIKLSVSISDYKNTSKVSWTHNGSFFIPDNNTPETEPEYGRLHLINNNFLLAIKDTIPLGTRLYMCAEIPYPNEQNKCQWDAVDKKHTGVC